MVNYKFLKEIRKKENLSAKEVADKIGVSYNTLMNYESGLREPSIDILVGLSTIYNVSIDYLINGKEFSYSFKDEEIKAFIKILKTLMVIFFNSNVKLKIEE